MNKKLLERTWKGRSMNHGVDLQCTLVGVWWEDLLHLSLLILPHQNPGPAFLRGLFGEIFAHNWLVKILVLPSPTGCML